ncbi:MAG: single-stranded DNA-binding protein [Leptolyngbyaceae bacterium]|nr:single-stranded DNA-binding protein [Leptolyngbyaceae bacterium]
MNNCVLMVEIIEDPKLRYTPDNQTPVADMIVQFAGMRPEDPPSTLKVVGWGNLAQEIQERYHKGDRVVIEGRLKMDTIERAEGFKEKKAELVAQRIHSLGMAAGGGEFSTTPTSFDRGSAPLSEPSSFIPPSPSKPASVSPAQATPKPASKPQASSQPAPQPDYDDIPF